MLKWQLELTDDRKCLEMAEGVGFEPTRTFALPVFKTGAINRSTTPPSFETRENCATGAELSKVDRALRRSILSIARGAADPPYRSTAVYVHVNLHDAGASTKDEKEVCPDRRGSAATLSGDSRPKRFLEPR